MTVNAYFKFNDKTYSTTKLYHFKLTNFFKEEK